MVQAIAALKPHERIIHPLDTGDGVQALQTAQELADLVGMFKVGLQLFYSRSGGWWFIDRLRGLVGDERIMLDLKLEDIPDTMRGALDSLLRPERGDDGRFRPKFLTVHAGPGSEHLAACVDAVGPDVGILGVTVLTSVDKEMWEHNRCAGDLRGEIYRRAVGAMKARCAGIVCSARDLDFLRDSLGPSLLRVCPGIRLEGGDKHDQKRSMTPAEAYSAGADYLVIGRDISKPKTGTSAESVVRICEQIAGATRIEPQPTYQPDAEDDGA